MVIVVMGVAGSGKTTVGRALAGALGWSFHDADEFHSTANVAKMTAGIPLNDEDRAPWLASIRAFIEERLARGENAIVTCSALRESHRRIIVADPARVRLVYLRGDYALLRERIGRRQGHFMKEALLKSQCEALEPPEQALAMDIDRPPEEIVAAIRRALSL